jgi:hypothetical protein
MKTRKTKVGDRLEKGTVLCLLPRGDKEPSPSPTSRKNHSKNRPGGNRDGQNIDCIFFESR